MRQELLLAAAIGLCFAVQTAQADEPVPTYKQVKQILSDRCQPCHSNEIETHGIYEAPGGIRYDTAEEIRAFAKGIYRTAVEARTMPPEHTTEITESERKTIAAWYNAGAPVP